MSLHVPGLGEVPIVWMPASDSDFGDGRGGKQPIAVVHHRIVGELNSADVTFVANDTDPATIGAPTRSVSSHFGIGNDSDGKLYVHQYVDLSDNAYCNGDYREPCNWQAWGYPTALMIVEGVSQRPCNPMTVSIEHDDNATLPDGDPRKGVVDEATIKTSIALDRLMLTGDIAAMRAAGIHVRDLATATALGKIVPGPRTLIDHHDIAGANKPYCWRPWKEDKIGFPRSRYIAELTAPPPAPMYSQAQLDAAVAAAKVAGARAEYARQAAGAKVALLPLEV